MLLVVALFATTMMAKSQEMSSSDYKPASGDIAIEVNAAPFSASPISINGLKGRYFISDNMVARLGLTVKSLSKKTIDNTDPNNTVESKENMFSFGLQPGIEIHRDVTNRFNTYFGGELLFSTQSAKTEVKSGSTTTTQDGVGMGVRKGTSFGLNAILGGDYYITKKIYLGAEIGFGFISEKSPELKWGDPSVVQMAEEKNFGLGFNYNSMFRLGFKF